jgi:hypothetical protein
MSAGPSGGLTGRARIIDQATGDVYDGDWFDGKRHGQGLIEYQAYQGGPPGSSYVGQWQVDEWNGQGKLLDKKNCLLGNLK